VALSAEKEPSPRAARRALQKAVRFFHSQVARHGGYVWRYSSDLQHAQGEAAVGPDRIWIQPPGTPAVGLAFLRAYRATGHSQCLEAARDAAHALVKTQLHSGGWDYSGTFDPQDRAEHNYRVPPTAGKPDVSVPPGSPGGWKAWSQRRYSANKTVMDDDTTQAALRLLIQVDKELDFEDEDIHEAALYGLRSMLAAQYPVGAWSHNYDRFPRRSPDPEYYPVREASYPSSWSRTWTKDFSGCYMLNDGITLDAIRTMLAAYKVYGKEKYRVSALRGGRFLLRAQMPSPQPAWAQQYDRHMHPVWDRTFEPPAITGLESQDVLETLLLLYQRTGRRQFLEPVGGAIAYLERSELQDGTLARFYELKTNRPLFFTEDYALTHEREKMPSHYSFVVNSRLDAIALRYRRLVQGGAESGKPGPTMDELIARARRAIGDMDDRGAWTEPGRVRSMEGRKVEPAGGIIRSRTFIRNLRILGRYLHLATGERR
jgi:hypothetical protein